MTVRAWIEDGVLYRESENGVGRRPCHVANPEDTQFMAAAYDLWVAEQLDDGEYVLDLSRPGEPALRRIT